MRRALGILAAAALVVVLVVLATGASGGGGGDYRVRAIFQNAFSLVPGEDVKIAGVKVGSIKSLDVTPQQTAAVVLDITKSGFKDFRADAECTIRPQSLIGEKFVECTPTQPRAVDQQIPPELPVIRKGPGKGEHLLPVTNTSRPIDVDLVNDIMRLPYRQRLGIIINEFGTGLAGRGGDLNQVIRNADPALKSVDRLLRLLSSQDRTLADLAKQSDISLAPLARERQHVANFVQHAEEVATATAERRAAFQAQFEKLPAFLRQLRPTAARLTQFADQATPVLANLRKVAPSVSRLIEATGPFSKSATISLTSLGKATIPGTKALVAARPIVTDLETFAAAAKPLAHDLAGITTSFHDSGGVERLMDYIFYQVAAINGFDSFGHYLRASLILNLCSTYATTRDPACTANFQNTGATASAASNMTARQALFQSGVDLTLRRMAAVLRGMSPAEAIRLTSGDTNAASSTTSATSGPGGSRVPRTLTAGAGGGGRSAGPSSAPAPATSDPSQSPTSAPQQDAQSRLLDYLLGGGA